MHVATQREQVAPSALHQKALKAPLKQVTTAAVPPIEVDRISHREPVHPPGQIWPVRLRDQMKMITHEHEAENGDIKAARRFLQKPHEPRLILRATEDSLTGIPAGAQMIDRILKLNTQRPGHRGQ